MNRQIRGSLMLLTTAFIWGTSFVAQKNGMDTISPLVFNGTRNLIGAIVLVPIIYMFSLAKRKNSAAADTASPSDNPAKASAFIPADPAERKTLLIGGILCGLMLMAASNVQQIALFYTTAGKAGFITALYVILVPLMGLFLRRKIRPIFWVCVLAAAIGLYLLCIPADTGFGGINKGDLLMLCCSFLFACHIMVVDHFSPKVDGVKLSCVQFFVTAVVTLAIAPIIDPAMGFALPGPADILADWFDLLYVGILSCGVAYTFQVIAQADVDPTITSLILCLESVFSVLAGAALLGEAMGAREIVGCILMFAAIAVAQLPSKEERLKSKNPKEKTKA